MSDLGGGSLSQTQFLETIVLCFRQTTFWTNFAPLQPILAFDRRSIESDI